MEFQAKKLHSDYFENDQKLFWGDFPDSPVVKILSSNAKGTGSTPGQGIKVLHAVGCNEKFLLKLFLMTTKSEPPSTLF